MSEWLDRRLLAVAIGAAILYLFCFWEFIIGIKRSIKKLFNDVIMLDICRFIAYIVPRSNGDESTRQCETVTDHSGAGRGKLD
jgi:hypothetical protein